MNAYIKKEWMEWTRTGRGLILLIIFIFFGIFNPAIAKVTPWLYEMLGDSIGQSGLQVVSVEVDVMTSWTQFYKNGSILVIIFVLMCSSVFTNEYMKGTMILSITKGLSRKTVVISKMLMIYLGWTALYLVNFGITYGYNEYFWDNSIAQHIFLGAFAYWLFGMVFLSAMVMFSSIMKTTSQVMMGTGSVLIIMIILNFIPKCKEWLPLKCMEGLNLLNGAASPEDFIKSILVSCTLIFSFSLISVIVFNRREI